MTCKQREQRANFFHLARQTDDAVTARNLWQQGDRLGDVIEKREQAEAFRRPFDELPEVDRPANPRAATPEYRAAFETYLRGNCNALSPEHRSLSVDKAPEGGYLMPAQQVAQVVAGRNTTAVRSLATRHELDAAVSLGVPSIDADLADPTWTVELSSGTEDSDLRTGGRELHPHPLAKRLKASGKLARRSRNFVPALLAAIAYKFAVAEENAFLNGTGDKKPLGLFTPSGDGISTGRDVATGNTSTAITFDGLVNALGSLKDQYVSSPSCRWLFHRDAVKSIRLLRDESGGADTGPYLWQPSVIAGQPDLLLGIPVISSEYVPNTFTSGLYVGLIGDLSYYHIADALTMRIQVLSELYALTDQLGYLGRLETDGMPVLEEAFARVKLG